MPLTFTLPTKSPSWAWTPSGGCWDEDRDGPDEVFTLATDILAIDGDTAVIRAGVRYGDPLRQGYRDLLGHTAA